MLAKKITEYRMKNEPIIHRLELKKLSEIALEKVAKYFIHFRELENLDEKYRVKVYERMSVDYPIEIVFPLIDYEPYWERAAKKHFNVIDCSIHGNSWKQCYAEKYIEKLISNYNSKVDNMEDIVKILDIVKFHVFNLEVPTFSSEFDIANIPTYFVNLTTLGIKYSPVLRGDNTPDLFKKKLTPIGDEFSKFGLRVPDLKKFSILMSDLSYLLSLSLQGNIIDDDMIKWLVSGLICNHTLRCLDLSHNNITEKGMIKLSSFIFRSKCLVSLDVSDNKIGGEGGFAMGLILKENLRLRVLKAAMNRLNDQNGSKIFKMLAKNDYLEELDLSNNDLSEEVTLY